MSSFYDDSIKKYYKKLSREEEKELVARRKKGDLEAEHRLIYSNLKFVVKLSHKYLGQGLPLEDIISSGTLGLTYAAKRYDPGKHGNDRFITYAVWYIRKYIFDAILLNKFIYRIPNGYLNDILLIVKVYDSLSKKYHREPSRQELIKETGLNDDRYDKLDDLIHQNKFVSLSDFVNKAKKITYADVIKSNKNNIEENYELRERRQIIFKALNKLTEREKDIIIKYYGLSGEKQTLSRISEDMKITKEAVRIIKEKALIKLKTKGKNILNNLL